MWYNYLRRDQHYLRSYRTHNLWFDHFALKARSPRVTGNLDAVLKRLGKTPSGGRMVSFIWGFSCFSVLKFMTNFSATTQEDPAEMEAYHRLITIFGKNKFGYHTRFMSDFELLLEAMLNNKFIDDATLYYDDPITSKEIEDIELGLNGDFSHADTRHLLKDKNHGHHELFKSLRNPDRVGTNYEKSDALSCYKILPKGQKPLV
mmetsp:Transcript_49242/g.67008  ORF Transcript_49242/g.67008 Transcript_49242/m.67008 type:complete len:204 (-) Transcript_49242:109-720(-)|eukprot:CAMPEP_0176379838 /NCGR_PEP_ID=MMETSP0126-20121128/30648_1 /TAXON_ID=141414 ORGANISM="Strombidinopsis acuminatum, Strain SPMC142" /NCGR_SAMPLE_ID=MMETSP0126 /ASSEMBLY_ACC=CAM_ASM_000229 /LENGTH=203 /DNA_ID=CAMNT_0017742795 /DNA_START=19 /DNA_END=630 /DNA_ORIENTATION=+